MILEENNQKLKALKERGHAVVLGIETSCDETAAAVVSDGRVVCSNVLYTQIEIHAKYGGVVPEIASRNHVEKLPYIVKSALAQAGMELSDLDALAVTEGPGLVGALLTGVSYAKALAYAAEKPLIAVNHIEGHISANYISHSDLQPPFICLIVSGGHTNLVKVEDYGKYKLLGTTRDDAAGEAFDKVARVLGLPYPGGPNLQKLAEQGDQDAYEFPRAFKGETHLDFSFSGLKTAVVNLVHRMEQKGEAFRREDIAASFQKAAVGTLVRNTFEAARREGLGRVVLAGGVSANAVLREQALAHKDCEIYLPKLEYCTDNAAMIASAAYYRLMGGCEAAPFSLNADPSLELISIQGA